MSLLVMRYASCPIDKIFYAPRCVVVSHATGDRSEVPDVIIASPLNPMTDDEIREAFDAQAVKVIAEHGAFTQEA